MPAVVDVSANATRNRPLKRRTRLKIEDPDSWRNWPANDMAVCFQGCAPAIARLGLRIAHLSSPLF
jgi:hypothetical protein